MGEEPEDLEDLGDDGFESLVMQMAALEAIVEANRREGPLSRAIELARQALEVQKAPSTFEQYVVRTSLQKVTKEPLGLDLPSRSTTCSWNTYVYETLSIAWLRWVTLGDQNIIGLPKRLLDEEPDTDREPNGAVEQSALMAWGQAIENLVLGDLDSSKRYFERAIGIGSQVGSESNLTINWCYAASFFPVG